MQIDRLFQGNKIFQRDQFDLINFRRFLNYPESRDLPANITGFLDSLLPGIQTSPISYQYRVLRITGRNAENEQVSLAEQFQFEGPMISRLLSDCDLVVVHMLSLHSDRFTDDWQSFVSYCFNNTLIQMSSDSLRGQVLKDLAIPEIRLTPRYAPGYCGWPLSDQEILLQLLEPAEIGVSYMDAFTLQPAHTITGIYGVRNHDTISFDMPCYKCTSISCGAHFDFITEI